MNVVQALQDYVGKMVDAVQGMKVLLLDKETTGIISMVCTQSRILEKDVFLIERLDQERKEPQPHLKALCFIRPTGDIIRLLSGELQNPKYGGYYIFFSNVCRKSYIEDLAEADEQELVQHVQEFYADYFAVNSDLFSLNVPSVIPLLEPSWDQRLFERIVDGITAALLSLKKKPTIRCQGSSKVCCSLAQEIRHRFELEAELFEFRRPDTPPLLLLLDRREDPVTPLLNQWTYQSMVHELLGIHNGRVDLRGVPGIRKDLEEVVLSPDLDAFFKDHMYSNFGDLGVAIKAYVEEYDRKTQGNHSIQTIEDMQRFVESYPEFRKLSGSVSKHVAIMSELSRLIDERALMEVSELEQELAVVQDHAGSLRKVKEKLKNPLLTHHDRLRLVLLYALRYELATRNGNRELIDIMHHVGVDDDLLGLIEVITKFAGAQVRGWDIFGNRNILNMLKSHVTRGLKGVENVYTQHEPLLVQIIDGLLKGKLKESMYPFIHGDVTRDRPHDIIIFVVGGTTYEEAFHVAQLNKAGGVRIVLGGTTIHNSETFLEDISQLSQSEAVNKLRVQRERMRRRL